MLVAAIGMVLLQALPDPERGWADYGVWGLLILFLLRFVAQDLWPWIRDTLSSDKKKKNKIDAATALAAIQADAEQRQEERDRRSEERKFRHDIDLRQTVAIEKMVEMLAVINERQQQMLTAQATLSTFMIDSVLAMRETVTQFHGVPGRPPDNPSTLPRIGGEPPKGQTP